MKNNDFLVDAAGVHAWYASSHVLHGIDIQIARGQTMGLLGRNGMGKSTLIRTLLGHVTQREGRITLFGKDASWLIPSWWLRHPILNHPSDHRPDGLAIALANRPVHAAAVPRPQ